MSQLPDIQLNGSSQWLPGNGRPHDFDISTLCRDIHTKNVFVPILDESVRTFMNVCTPHTEVVLNENWTFCDHNEDYSCTDIWQYTKSCAETRKACQNVEKCSDSAGGCSPGVMAGLVIAGVVVGMFIMAVICLVFPKLHQWKLKKEKSVTGEGRGSLRSDSYVDIDGSHTQTLSHRRGFSPTNPLPENFEARHSEPINEYAEANTEPYEELHRHNPNKQSHKYAPLGVIPETSDQTPEENMTPTEQHTYFVLDKT